MSTTIDRTQGLPIPDAWKGSPADDPVNPIKCDCGAGAHRPRHMGICSRNVWGMTEAEQDAYWRGMR